MEEVYQENLIALIKKVSSTIRSDLKITDEGLSYIDPIDGVEISAHYAQSHAAVGFILLGKYLYDIDLYNTGLSLLNKLLNTYDRDIKKIGYHYDFNNFALALLLEIGDLNDKELESKIKKIILTTPDSNHFTTNWLPMRMFVNRIRSQITGDDKYEKLNLRLLGQIKCVTYKDGFIDDQTPKGTSFNLQYDTSTLSTLLLYETFWGKLDYNISKGISALVDALAPDGDINYLGRGTNQIFAWGPWFYILRALGKQEIWEKSFAFFNKKIDIVLQKRNILLNEFDGREKFLWWDYHYSSVYTAHLFLWLVLSLTHKPISITYRPSIKQGNSETLNIFRNSNFFVAVTQGRLKYLAEKGPSVSAIGVGNKMIVKASFAPWQGAFGNKYSFTFPAFLNFCGFFKVKKNLDWSRNKVLKRVLKSSQEAFTIKPLFIQPIVCFSTVLNLEFINSKNDNVFFNFPVLKGSITKNDIIIKCDGVSIPLYKNMEINSQYGEIELYQTRECNGYNWQISIIP